MRLQLLVILLSASILSACTKPEKGIVVDKQIEPESTYLVLLPVNQRIVSTTIIQHIPHFIHDNEDYTIFVRNANGTQKVYVNQSYYNCISKVGAFEPGKDCSLSDDNNTKTPK